MSQLADVNIQSSVGMFTLHSYRYTAYSRLLLYTLVRKKHATFIFVIKIWQIIFPRELQCWR